MTNKTKTILCGLVLALALQSAGTLQAADGGNRWGLNRRKTLTASGLLAGFAYYLWNAGMFSNNFRYLGWYTNVGSCDYKILTRLPLDNTRTELGLLLTRKALSTFPIEFKEEYEYFNIAPSTSFENLLARLNNEIGAPTDTTHNSLKTFVRVFCITPLNEHEKRKTSKAMPLFDIQTQDMLCAAQPHLTACATQGNSILTKFENIIPYAIKAPPQRCDIVLCVIRHDGESCGTQETYIIENVNCASEACRSLRHLIE